MQKAFLLSAPKQEQGTVDLAMQLLDRLQAQQGVNLIPGTIINSLIEALECEAINRAVAYMPYPNIEQFNRAQHS